MEFRDGMRCPACESGSLKEKWEDIKFEYKGTSKTFPKEKVYSCNRCGEYFFDQKRNREIDKSLTDHRRHVDGFLTSSEIKSIREMFGKTQVEFAKLLGVGEKNFARYESGQAVQSKAMDNLLRVLSEYPEAIFLFEDKQQIGEKFASTQVVQYISRIHEWAFSNNKEADDYSCELAVNYV